MKIRSYATAPVWWPLALLVWLSGCDSQEAPRLVGTLERDRIEVVAEEAEPIVSLDVREGDRVSAGQILIRQDTAISAARRAQAEAQVAEARHRLMELEHGSRIEDIDEGRARLAAARSTLDRDEREFTRADELVRQRLISQSDLDQRRAARDTSRAMLREAEAALAQLVRGARVEQVDQARAAMAAAESSLKQIELTDDRLVVRAMRAGVVEALPYKMGERPPVGTPVVIMLADTPAFARVYVPEPLRVHLKPRDRAEIFIDGEAQPVAGFVRFVASDAAFTPYYALTQRDRSRLVFLAEIELEDASTRNFPAGVPVEVQIASLSERAPSG